MTRFQMFKIQSIGVLGFPAADAKTRRLKASYISTSGTEGLALVK